MFLENLPVLLAVLLRLSEVSCSTPVVLWHGIGDDHLQSIKNAIRDNAGDSVYIKSIQLGITAIEDVGTGIFVHPNIQITEVCQEILEDEKLKNGFHAIGFSQGAQFM